MGLDKVLLTHMRALDEFKGLSEDSCAWLTGHLCESLDRVCGEALLGCPTSSVADLKWALGRLPRDTPCARMGAAVITTIVTRGMAGGPSTMSEHLSTFLINTLADPSKAVPASVLLADTWAEFMASLIGVDVSSLFGAENVVVELGAMFLQCLPGSVLLEDMHPSVSKVVQKGFHHPVEVQFVGFVDIARTKGSLVGPAITDIRVRRVETERVAGSVRLRLGDACACVLMDRFNDTTVLWPADKFKVWLGNVSGTGAGRMSSLYDLLSKEGAPDVGNCTIVGPLLGSPKELVLVSAMSAIVSCDKSNQFVITLDTYRNPNPTLVVLATALGTSCVVVPALHSGEVVVMHNNRGTGATLSVSGMAEATLACGFESVSHHGSLEAPSSLKEPAHTIMVYQIPLQDDGVHGRMGAGMHPGLIAKGIVARGSLSAPSSVTSGKVSTGVDVGPFEDMGGRALVRKGGAFHQVRATMILVECGSKPVSREAKDSIAMPLDKLKMMYHELCHVLSPKDGPAPVSVGSLVTGAGNPAHSLLYAGAGSGATSLPPPPPPASATLFEF